MIFAATLIIAFLLCAGHMLYMWWRFASDVSNEPRRLVDDEED